MAKKNNALIVKIGIWIVGIAFAAGGFYLLVNFRLDTVEGDVKRIKNTDLPGIEDDIAYHDDRLYEQEKEVFGLKKEVGYLGEKVDKSLEVQQQILTEIKELRK